jgi:vacuolar-type H+-ATPase subunit I/STV1
MAAATTTSKPKTQQETYATLSDLQTVRREIHEDFSSFRHELINQLRELDSKLSNRTQTNWSVVIAGVSVGLILAGMAAALINTIIVGEASMREMMVADLNSHDQRNQSRIDQLLERELADSYSRGLSEQRFKTLEAEIASAIANRKDIDSKHVDAQQRLDARIDELSVQVSHEINNGLGRRISEMQAPNTERIISLERAVFNDSPNYRDSDRK